MISKESPVSESSLKPPTTNKEATVTVKKSKGHVAKTYKIKGLWRETQLAKPKMPQEKYTPPYAGPLRLINKTLVIDSEVLGRCDQLAFAQLRTIYDNRRDYKLILDDKKFKNLAKQEEKNLNSIYSFYKRNLMIKEQKFQKAILRKALMAKSSRKNVKETQEQRESRIVDLAKPKKSFKDKPPKRGTWKALEQMSRYIDLADPIKRDVLPPKMAYQVSPATKNYIATDKIVKLAQQPKRFGEILAPLDANRPVPKSALTYKITPRIEKLYVVKMRKEGTTTTPEDDVWKISPAALKYQASPRMLQLAKPIERK